MSANGGRLRVTVHPGDISGGSPEAWLWIDGFLCGQEADLFEFLGGSAELLDDHDEDDIARWIAWNERFRRHGWAPHLQSVPEADPILDELTGPQPWAYSGDRYWTWQQGAWAVAQPQPVDPDPEHPGCAMYSTLCVQRGHHLLVGMGSISACEDCNYVN